MGAANPSGDQSWAGPKEGLIRAALAVVVLVCLTQWWTFQGSPWAYATTAFAAAFGLLLAVRPNGPAGWAPVRAGADAVALGVLLADTGGGVSPFFPLYFLAALCAVGLAGRVAGAAQLPTAAAVMLVGGYVLAVALDGGPGGPGSSRFVVNAGALSLFCVVLLYLGAGVRRAEHVEKAEDAPGRNRGTGSDSLTRILGSPLGALSVESALGVVAEVAGEISGGSYTHVAALRGNLHRTIMTGRSDACPSWWHPSVQRLLLWSCREGTIVRREETVHGVEGFVAVPVGLPDREKWGAIIVGGGRVGEPEEHALQELSAIALPALARRPDAGGGLDFSSGLPNAASLSRVLQTGLSSDATPGVLAVDPGASKADENPLVRLGKRLQDAGRRVFRYDESTLIVLIEGAGRDAVAGKARALGDMLAEEADDPKKATAGTTVGFAVGGLQGQSTEDLVGTALGALEKAWAREEKVAGAADPPGDSLGMAVLDADAPHVRCLVRAMVARDPYLSAHSEGVSRIACRIGRVMSLSEEQLDALKIGALLHDIGKIGISDRILHKPSRLTEEEYALVKRHPGLGAEILSALPELAPVLPLVRHHHERFDGLGYPDGLRGEKIPILARVVCTADAFDSLTRERPYKRPVSAEAALAEIGRNAGSQFDPGIAEALSRSVAGPGDSPADFAV